MNDNFNQTINIPIEIKNGRVKYLYGNVLPEMKDRAEGNLVMHQDDVIDKDFISKVQKEKKIKLFDKDETLLIAVNVNYIPEKKRKDTQNIQNIYPQVPYNFIDIKLKKPLYLNLRGTKKATLSGGECVIPVLNMEEVSINSAYTKISETYETERKSHTVNVFTKCYFYDNQLNKWKKLDLLREKHEDSNKNNLYIQEDEMKFQYNIFKLNLNEEEMKVIKYIEMFGELSTDKIKDIFHGDEERYIKTIKNLVYKNVLSDIDR